MKKTIWNQIHTLLEKYKELIRYLISGVLTTAVNFLIYGFLREFSLSKMFSQVIAFIFSILFAYIINKCWVFSGSKAESLLKEFLSFVSGRLVVSALFDLLLFYLLIKYTTINEYVVKGITTFLTIVCNYLLSKFLVFKKEPDSPIL